ncbi:tRNA 2-thiouridine(34) synthase MnmA [Tessaracoccus sp. OH4464_COT-324]|uniref:tRNA 2-thiouridine(34) synthase MnmA n=1 Tax=Tessaracoccus sp. OH4464_COT-324 TaxID=2491059 RepID=UPI000F62DE51|nr:tRNA 2-thiouridine(34) synthase MnmA [Tessaracoccus sp. OH4464_COT-324]RRD47909.1 tRNA 2-thiouridine(34) synthase MnmA [Tessaracoccus sp. OH4464_COT-324]
MRVLVAMSGGVDSAVAAARMVAAGHEVTGVHLALSKNPQAYRSGSRGCCSLEDSHDARRVADRLDIPFYIWDFADDFDRSVVQDFIEEYRAGRTPNPCLRCNEKIKFAAVLDRAVKLGFDAVATGHYARLEHSTGRVRLYRAADRDKDQSYVLGMLNQAQLSRCLFPLYDVAKAQVREEARALGLGVAKKPDSHDICFIPDGDTQGFLAKHLGREPGPIADRDGNVLGTHAGHHNFTIGQRKGLDLRVPAEDGSPRYVLRIEPKHNTVVVGNKSALAVKEVRCIRPTWTQEPRLGTWRGSAQYRAHGADLAATFETDGEELQVRFDEPTLGVAPGQSVVHYQGDEVLGSAIIAEAH